MLRPIRPEPTGLTAFIAMLPVYVPRLLPVAVSFKAYWLRTSLMGYNAQVNTDSVGKAMYDTLPASLVQPHADSLRY